MKTAVITYTYDGNSAFVAKHISSILKADILQIQTLDEKKRRGFLKILWGGWQVIRGKMPELKPYTFDPTPYDLIILGTPVWAGRPAPAIKSFLSKTNISGKKLALFVCHRGGPGKAMIKFKDILKDNAIVSEKDFYDPIKHAEKVIKEIEDWLKTLNL